LERDGAIVVERAVELQRLKISPHRRLFDRFAASNNETL
jgi:hypothetical protein